MNETQLDNYKEFRFLVDAMLVKLGKFMRILGFDTEIADNSLPDNELIHYALNTNRLLITMDKSLKERSLFKKKKIIFVRNNKLIDQLVQIYTESGLDFFSVDIDDPVSYYSRCSTCNSLLRFIQKDNIKEHIPKQTYEVFNNFWKCSNESCGKIYWRGSHWKKISDTINLVKNRLD